MALGDLVVLENIFSILWMLLAPVETLEKIGRAPATKEKHASSKSSSRTLGFLGSI
jgi:hypothetical protein